MKRESNLDTDSKALQTEILASRFKLEQQSRALPPEVEKWREQEELQLRIAERREMLDRKARKLEEAFANLRFLAQGVSKFVAGESSADRLQREERIRKRKEELSADAESLKLEHYWLEQDEKRLEEEYDRRRLNVNSTLLKLSDALKSMVVLWLFFRTLFFTYACQMRSVICFVSDDAARNACRRLAPKTN